MAPSELVFSSALEQAEMLERREVSSVELVECYLERIERLNPRLDSYITVASDHARAAARDADVRRAAGGEVPRFLGVPISIKDLADTAGIVSTHGTADGAIGYPTATTRWSPSSGRPGSCSSARRWCRSSGPSTSVRLRGIRRAVTPGIPTSTVADRRAVPPPRCGRDVPRLAWFRRRRFHPEPVVVVWRLRAQAPARSHFTRTAPTEHVLT